MASENLVNGLYEIIQANSNEKISYNDFEKDLLKSINLSNDEIDRALALILSQAEVNPNILGETKGGTFIVSPSLSAAVISTIKYENQFIPGKEEFESRMNINKNIDDITAGLFIMTPELIDHFVNNLDKISTNEKRALIGNLSKMTYDQRKKVVSHFRGKLDEMKEEASTPKDAETVGKVGKKLSFLQEMDDALQTGDSNKIKMLAESEQGKGMYGFDVVGGVLNPQRDTYEFQYEDGQLIFNGVKRGNLYTSYGEFTSSRGSKSTIDDFSKDATTVKLQLCKNEGSGGYVIVVDGDPKSIFPNEYVELDQLQQLIGRELPRDILYEHIKGRNIEEEEKVLDTTVLMQLVQEINNARNAGDFETVRKILKSNPDIVNYAKTIESQKEYTDDELSEAIVSGEVVLTYEDVVDYNNGNLRKSKFSYRENEAYLTGEMAQFSQKKAASKAFGQNEQSDVLPKRDSVLESLKALKMELLLEYSEAEVEVAMNLFKEALISKRDDIEMFEIDSEEALRESLMEEGKLQEDKTRKIFERIVGIELDAELLEVVSEDFEVFVEKIDAVTKESDKTPIPEGIVQQYVETNAVDMYVNNFQLQDKAKKDVIDKYSITSYDYRNAVSNTETNNGEQSTVEKNDFYSGGKSIIQSVRKGQLEDVTLELKDLGKMLDKFKTDKSGKDNSEVKKQEEETRTDDDEPIQ